MRLVKSSVGKYAGTDLISLYVDEANQVEYYASSKLLVECKTWDTASVSRIVCDTPTKRTYKAIFSKDKRLTAVWLKSLHLHRDEITDVTSIAECLDTMVTEDETVVSMEPEVDDLEIPDVFASDDDDLFGDLEEVQPISMIEVEPEQEPEPEPELEPEQEDDLFGDEEPSMINVQEIMEEEEEVQVDEVEEVEVEDIGDIQEIEEVEEIEEVKEVEVDEVEEFIEVQPSTRYHSQFNGGLPAYLNEAVACLVKAGVSFTVVEQDSHYVIKLGK